MNFKQITMTAPFCQLSVNRTTRKYQLSFRFLGICQLSVNPIQTLLDEHNLLKEAYAFLFRSPRAFLQNQKWRNMLRSNG